MSEEIKKITFKDRRNCHFCGFLCFQYLIKDDQIIYTCDNCYNLAKKKLSTSPTL
jgi:hypothetical protein